MRIAAYYSNGLLYGARLQALRQRYPEAHITAIVPPGFTMPAGAEVTVDAIVHTESAQYSPRQIAACVRLVRLLRSGRHDLFVVMFDSVLLNALAWLTGAGRAECWSAESRILPMPRSPFGLAYRIFLRGIIGHGRLLWMWWQTHRRSVDGPLLDNRPIYETRIPPDLRRILRLRLVYRTKAGRAKAARGG